MGSHQVDVSVVVVTWNSQAILKACLQALRMCPQEVRFETWVIDNASSDGTVAMVRDEFPAVSLIINETNCGFAGGVNRGLEVAHGRYVMVLNPDTEVCANTLSSLVHFLDAHPEAGGAGPRLLYPDGSIQQIGFYRKTISLPQVLLFYTPLRWAALRSRFLKERYWEHQDHRFTCAVDQPPGAALMVRREVVRQVGMLDETFFLYFEDVDWCYRIRKAGWSLYFVAEAQLVHQVGGSTSQLGPLVNHYLFLRSMVQYVRKHHGRLNAAGIAMLVTMGSILEYVALVLRYFFLPAHRARLRHHLVRISEIRRFVTGRWWDTLQGNQANGRYH